MTNAVNPSSSARFLAPLYLGLPMWQDPGWPTRWFADNRARAAPLHYYSQQFNSVEGNSLFYALPDASAIARWHEQTPAEFRFTFKFNQAISHSGNLLAATETLSHQLTLMAPLAEKTGPVMLQLPASFGPPQLGELARFLTSLPETFSYAVEVRHMAFFDKADNEIALNRLLMAHQVNRVIMDTRALFAGPADSALTAEVRQKKPRVPVHAIATGASPIVRFVAGNNESENEKCMTPWLARCHQWREEGLSPYVFFHKPDNHYAPWLANNFITRYNQLYPQSPLPALRFSAAEQGDLF